MLPDVQLAELAHAVGAELIGSGRAPIHDVTHDSRQVRPGSLFVAVRGFSADGHDFVAQAVERGAAAVCVEAGQDVGIPQLVVPNGRASLPVLAAVVHHRPSERLRVVGVTGTNGKTTVAYLLESITAAAGIKNALVGTIGARIAGRPVPVGRTTPEATDLQRLLAEMAEEGVDVAAIEVSSHALALGRVDEISFAVGAFTNLTQDHLDFHQNMEDYFAAKASLFRSGRTRQAVIWVDDPHGERLAHEATIPVTRVGMRPGADVRADAVEINPAGSRFQLVIGDQSCEIDLPLGGAFNIENATVAAACAHVLGVTLKDIEAGLRGAPQIPGRFELVSSSPGFSVIVDYAHTPEGIDAAIAAARAMTGGAVIVVIGAGGDRDRLKRPRMGLAAAAADLAIITSDNPRSEDPLAIIAEIVAGAGDRRAGLRVVHDRRAAIRTAIRRAAPGDVVLILGKGHEQGQEIAGRIEPFDDRIVVREELEKLGVAS